MLRDTAVTVDDIDDLSAPDPFLLSKLQYRQDSICPVFCYDSYKDSEQGSQKQWVFIYREYIDTIYYCVLKSKKCVIQGYKEYGHEKRQNTL